MEPILKSAVTGPSSANGGRPAAISITTMPSDQTSAFSNFFFFFTFSAQVSLLQVSQSHLSSMTHIASNHFRCHPVSCFFFFSKTHSANQIKQTVSHGVPVIVPGALLLANVRISCSFLDAPKSANLTTPSGVIKIFPPLRSL